MLYLTYWLLLACHVLHVANSAVRAVRSKRPRHDRYKDDANIRRPENGTGPIMISYENGTMPRNEKRILVVFDRECLDDIDDPEEHDKRFMYKIDNIRQRYVECLDLYNLSRFHYDTDNSSYVFMDLHCPVAMLQEKKNISLDYDELCIEYIMYEPLFWLNQTSTTLQPTTTTEPTHQCSNISTDHTYSYGQDLLDSPWFDGRYSFVDIDTVSDTLPFIAVIDSGIQSDHIEFETGQIVHEMGSGPASIQTNIGTLYDSHGTHVAGSASGRNYGTSRGLTIYDYKVCEFDEDYEVPCYTSDITDAMDRILQKLRSEPGRRGVINLSLGGEKTYAMNDIYHSYFDKMIDAGGIPVVAAGNEDVDACGVSPAYSSKAITVGAFAYDFINTRREKAWFSNWGTCVDIWGPGEDIYSAVPSADSNDKYAFLSGTSMATPMIVGVVANLLAVQPTLSFDGVLNALMANSTEVTYDQCDQYECRAPVYACGKREYGDEIPWEYEEPWSLLHIVLIVVGALIVVVGVIAAITWCTRNSNNKNHSSHQAVPVHDTETFAMNGAEEQQAIIQEVGPEGEIITYAMT